MGHKEAQKAQKAKKRIVSYGKKTRPFKPDHSQFFGWGAQSNTIANAAAALSATKAEVQGADREERDGANE